MRQLVIIIFILIFQTSYSQSTDYKGNTISVGISYFEIKDQLNHGLVFKGPDIRLNYGYDIIDSSKDFNYTFSIGGGGKTTNETWAGTWYVSPVKSHYLWRVKKSNTNSKIFIGPYFQAQYNVQNYPELHAGSILWLTSYEMGFSFKYFFTVKSKTIELSVQNSLLSLNSRTPMERDPYYFSTNIGDNFSDLHSNMVFGSFNQYNQTEISVAIYFDKKKRKSLSYTFNYIGYYDEPSYDQVFNQISYRWFLNKVKE